MIFFDKCEIEWFIMRQNEYEIDGFFPGAKPAGDAALAGRTLHECELKESIRLVNEHSNFKAKLTMH